MADEGTLEEAYERLGETGPEFEGWLSNHGPMAAEAMVRHGHSKRVHTWLDAYNKRLEERPRGTYPIGPTDWQLALGDPKRLGDWLGYFSREVEDHPWREVLATWWPRLVPGIAAGATHGVIRTGHVVHHLLKHDVPTGRAELGQALGYWAARWQRVPNAVRPNGRLTPAQALANVPRVPEQEQGINHRLTQLRDLSGWTASLDSLRSALTPDEARDRIAEVANAASKRYLTTAQGSPIMLVHAATAPTAVLRTLPAIPREQWAASLDAAWAASAAVTAAYAPAIPADRDDLPAADGTPDEIFARAVEHGDEHVIKLADTCLDVYARTGDADVLASVVRATQLTDPLS
ncbi:questin oxidase family protein [Tenggerimyces flavus]|uniref:Questin oxidase family protein n=1 Tax=Tenggerimyces flavus TaxID=1708749 RepID=A0ABV7Y8E8_9ACTN|nr:questin oxidase family protein [Tenggerimyces flavus]MBM7788494.1 hypothetical protein [Tenggerimyces flavus]